VLSSAGSEWANSYQPAMTASPFKRFCRTSRTLPPVDDEACARVVLDKSEVTMQGQGWRGIDKAAVQIHLTAIACNALLSEVERLKRTLNIVQQVG
jgi:hypothetical protein